MIGLFAVFKKDAGFQPGADFLADPCEFEAGLLGPVQNLRLFLAENTGYFFLVRKKIFKAAGKNYFVAVCRIFDNEITVVHIFIRMTGESERVGNLMLCAMRP